MKLGFSYINIEEFREKLNEYARRQGFELNMQKNDKIRVTTGCKGEGSNQRVYASTTYQDQSFVVKIIIEKHDCYRIIVNKGAIVKWIAKRFSSLIVSYHGIDIKDWLIN